MKKIANILLSVLLCAALLVGCGSVQSAAAEDSMNAEAAEGWSETGTPAPDEEQSEEASREIQPQSRKLIRNAELNLESKQFDETYAHLMKALKQANGYVEYSSEEGSQEEGNRWAEYTLRVPCQNYDSFLQAAENSGSLVSKNESVQDVTGQYVDIQARLESLKVQEQRLLELAAQAETMEDLLVIEEHLADVRYQIENYTAQQNTLNDQIDYSTVRVCLDEVTVYSPVSHSFSHQAVEAFKGSWENFVAGCQDFVIWLIYALPDLIVLAVIAAVVIVLARKWNTPARKEKRMQKRAAKAQMHSSKQKAHSDAAYNALYTQPEPKPEDHEQENG